MTCKVRNSFSAVPTDAQGRIFGLSWVSLREFARQTAQTIYQAHQQQWAPYLRQLLAKPLIPALLPTTA